MFEFSVEEVRKRCRDHDVYDKANFMKAFKQNGDLFEDFKKEDKQIKLNNKGKEELVKTIALVSKQ
jgi:hypothetical protein